jgi:hypothetical protein
MIRTRQEYVDKNLHGAKNSHVFRPIIATGIILMSMGNIVNADEYFNSDSFVTPIVSNNPKGGSVMGHWLQSFHGKCKNDSLPNKTSIESKKIGLPDKFTGLMTQNIDQIQCATKHEVPLPFIQVDSKTRSVGIWLNSADLTNKSHALMNSSSAFHFPPKSRPSPWQKGGAASLKWKMKLKTLEMPSQQGLTGPVVPYGTAWIVIQDPKTGAKVWYGAGIFDARGGNTDSVGYDPGSRLAMISSSLGNNLWIKSVSGEKYHQAFYDEKTIEIQVTAQNLQAGLMAYNAKVNSWKNSKSPPSWAGGLITWPTDVASFGNFKVLSISISTEIADKDSSQYDTAISAKASGNAVPNGPINTHTDPFAKLGLSLRQIIFSKINP